MTVLQAELERALGSRVLRSRPVAGGDINRALRVELADGRAAFVKHRPDLEPGGGMYEAEARGLAWLGEVGALRVPAVWAVDPRFLALEWIEPGVPRGHTWRALGEGLAALHRAGPARFGGPAGFIGTLPQEGGDAATWPELYGPHRLLPQLRLAARAGLATGIERRVERLVADLPQRVGPPEPPARLHGDLWGGNLLVAADGAPVLVDPAPYAGHRELDLAMMQLFGGFDPAVHAAYQAAWPLAPGWQERVPLYQLYFLLVHLNLFGAAWRGRVLACLDALGA